MKKQISDLSQVRLNRRAALAAGLAAPLSLAVPQPAAALPGLPSASSAGYFKVPGEGSALIGLLLPAVQRVREAAARLQFFDTRGELQLTIPLPLGSAPTPVFFDVFFGGPLQGYAGLDGGTVVIRERSTRKVWQVQSPDGNLMAVFLPAVQRGGGLLAGSVQVKQADGYLLLPYLEQDNLVEVGGHRFAGPFSLATEQNARIGLLLPAVQKVRAPATLLLLNSEGTVITRFPMSTEKAPGAQVGAVVDIAFADGSMRVEGRIGDGSPVLIGQGDSPDGILVALLLPAVQNNGKPLGILGGSLQTPTQTVGFTEVSGLTVE